MQGLVFYGLGLRVSDLEFGIQGLGFPPETT